MNPLIVDGLRENNNLITAAISYIGKGLSVIPLQANSKIPLVEWKPYTLKLASKEEICKWFENKKLNIGVITGSISGIVVIDLDGLQGLSEARKLKLYSRINVITPNGKHLWFKYPKEGIRNSASKVAEGIDIRGENGFVCAPPSIINGKKYRFLNSTVLNVEKLPSFPLGLGANSVDMGIVAKPIQEQKSESWISDALEEMKQGHVHNTLISVLGKFRHHNFSISDTVKLLRPYAFNVDGSPFEELEDKVKEIWNRYESNARSLQSSAVRVPYSKSDWEEFTFKPIMEGTRASKSGFLSLDAMLEGGLKSERIFTIAARTGENKTNTALAICKHLCEQNKKVLYFSTEFSFKKVWERYIALCSSTEEFRKHSFYVCDSFSPNIQQVEEIIKQVIPDVFIFDYIQHIAEEREALSSFMQGLTFLQKKYNCQGIVLAQLNRYADFIQDGKRIEPRLSMIKGADSIGQMSSRVLLLSVTKVSPEIDEIEAILDKNDSGSKGKFFLGLFKNPYRIEEIK